MAANPQYANIPAELRQPAMWLEYYLAPDKPGKKPRKHPKLPYSTPEDRATNLRTLDHLIQNRKLRKGEGYQRYIQLGEGFVFIDLDHVRDPQNGEIKPWALALIEFLKTYTEISQSGEGLHLVARGTLPEDFYPTGSPIEIYSGHKPNKLLAMTGDTYESSVAIESRQEQLEQILKRAQDGEFGPGKSATSVKTSKSSLPILDEPEIEPDEDVPLEFPRLPGALGQLVNATTPDLPYDHKALALITYVGLELARKVAIVPDYWLQPRFYSCMVSTASGGKSAADVEIRRALVEHGVLTAKVELSIDSGPALVEALNDDRRLILCPDELADQFEKARAGATGKNSLFGEMLRLFESNETGNHTKRKRGGKEGGCIEVHDAMFALLGGVTTERCESMWFGTGAAGSGLQSRFTYSFSDKAMPRLKTPNDDAAVQEAAQQLRVLIHGDAALGHMDETPGLRKFRLSRDAEDSIMEWRPFEDDGAEKMKRVLDMTKRFALVVAACNRAEEIDEETMRLALRFADYQIALRERLLTPDSATFVQAFENRIIAFFEKHGNVTGAVLQNNVKPEKLRGGYAAYNRAWSELLRAGKVRVVGQTRNQTVLYGVRT